MSLEGTQLGHYRLTQFLKGGGMGEIYLAEDQALPRQVAIKVMKTEGPLYPNSQTAQDVARLFQREMRAIAMLDHPNILTLLEAGEQNFNREQITYMVMPYCPAGSLSDWIKQYHSNSLLSPSEVAQLLTQAAEALQQAHDQHILHLDIKPQNFLVRRQQDPTALPNLLLADFGVAKIANTTKMSGTPRGTYFYMAPEQLANQPVPASDQYALAIMTYELLTGKTPFEGAMPQAIFYQHSQVPPEPPSRVNPLLPPVLDAVILRALAKKPEERFASIREFAQAFAAVVKSAEDQPTQRSGGYAGETETTVGQWRQPANVNPSLGMTEVQRQLADMQRQLAKMQRQTPVVQDKQPDVPNTQKRKLGFWWALLFGGIAGGLDGALFQENVLYSLGPITTVVIGCIISIIASFITSKITLRKWTGTITGIITGVILGVIGSIESPDAGLENDLLGIAMFIAIGALLGFIGALLGVIGRKRK